MNIKHTEKASYLLNSIDEKLGGVLEVTEVDNSNYVNYQGFFANTQMNYKASPGATDVNFKKIKLSYQINTTFEIAK